MMLRSKKTENGRRLVWRLLSHCGIYRDIHEEEPVEMARQLGRRSVGLWLLQVLADVNQDAVFIMMKEAKAQEDEIRIILEQRKKQEELDESRKYEADLGVGKFV